ncbi:Coenzyme PQQ synthesis protein D (PqqD) [Streptomyces sp. 1222.5]|uniref:lasso peptide biosynthesis B2 protein n=1 Tax=unclassified Streptomyces TaxID=2593676 RepID=UPI000897D54A|nr:MULTISPECIES: lasso peptide biosynthesis B2 protein [unclassified Streptomyces]PKW11406.1 coenzyme PQQ synthesis protein D (PqqD) [Streptomyces sp. 5112.2]SEB79903.1 Coenzyme PQQ synthesis protein D (PqqD) [Streptomyces sp. 1222.5]
MNRLEVPGYVCESHAANGGAVLLDARSGRCFAMNPMARVLWQEWRHSRDFEAGVREMTRLFPEPDHERIRQDARRLAGVLISRGLLSATAPRESPASLPGAPVASPVEPGAASVAAVTGDLAPDRGTAWQHWTRAGRSRDDGPVSWRVAEARRDPAGERTSRAGAEVTMAVGRLSPPGTGRMAARSAFALGVLGFLLALLLIRLPFRTLLTVVWWTQRYGCRREATAEHGAKALASVRRAAALYPGRAACLETSLATLLTLALSGRRAVWCIGTAVDPCRFHAWIETEGVLIKAADDHGIEAFRRILSV